MPGTPVVGQTGVGAPFPTTQGTIGGIQPTISVIACGPDGAPYVPQADSGIFLPLPVGFAAFDPNYVPVFVGDSNNNSIRASIIGSVLSTLDAQLADGSFYLRSVNNVVPAGFVSGYVGDVPTGTAGAARMSNDGVVQTTGPPRENFVQNWIGLTTGGEQLLLAAADAAGAFR